MDLRQLAAELEQLARLFERASCDWPNLISHLTTWPIGMPFPESPYQQSAVTVSGPTITPALAGEKNSVREIHIVSQATPFGAIWREISNTHFGKLTLHRVIGKLGRVPTSRLTGSDIDASQRLIVLGRQAVLLLQRLPNPPVLQKCIQFEQWRYFLHSQSSTEWQDVAGFSPEYRRHVIDDLFLESATALRRLATRIESGASVSDSETGYLGGGLLAIGSARIKLDGSECFVIEALVALQAATKDELIRESGVADAARVLGKVMRKHKLESLIRLPGRRGQGGYSTTIKDLRPPDRGK